MVEPTSEPMDLRLAPSTVKAATWPRPLVTASNLPSGEKATARRPQSSGSVLTMHMGGADGCTKRGQVSSEGGVGGGPVSGGGALSIGRASALGAVSSGRRSGVVPPSRRGGGGPASLPPQGPLGCNVSGTLATLPAAVT